MSVKKKQEKNWKEQLRERQLRYQRFLETHRKRMEKTLREKAKKAYRRKLLLASICIIVIIISVYGAIHYAPHPSNVQGNTQTNNEPTSPEQPSFFESDTILILPDGSIYPSNANASIARSGGNYYVVKANLTLPLKIGCDNIVIDGSGHTIKGGRIYGSRGIDLSGRKNVTLKNFRIEDFDYGVYLNSTDGCIISENKFMNNYCAVWVTYSSNNKVTLNTIANTSMSQGYGIWLKNSTRNLVSSNNISLQSYGMYLGYADYNLILNNHLKDNRIGMYFYSSSGNTITSNQLTDNLNGGIHLLASSNNTITLNMLSNNAVGLGLDRSDNNCIYNNNFMNNTQQVYSNNSTNIWDGGSIKGGNYWSDYTGADNNGDGIGDTPYIIDENNKDNYPLIYPKQ